MQEDVQATRNHQSCEIVRNGMVQAKWNPATITYTLTEKAVFSIIMCAMMSTIETNPARIGGSTRMNSYDDWTLRRSTRSSPDEHYVYIFLFFVLISFSFFFFVTCVLYF
jgi:hypothetical protein